jgi:hypothetical protein
MQVPLQAGDARESTDGVALRVRKLAILLATSLVYRRYCFLGPVSVSWYRGAIGLRLRSKYCNAVQVAHHTRVRMPSSIRGVGYRYGTSCFLIR